MSEGILEALVEEQGEPLSLLLGEPSRVCVALGVSKVWGRGVGGGRGSDRVRVR